MICASGSMLSRHYITSVHTIHACTLKIHFSVCKKNSNEKMQIKISKKGQITILYILFISNIISIKPFLKTAQGVVAT